jgi:hypothetical protein
MKLPAPGAPAPDARDALAAAAEACRGVRTISAEVGASGSIGGSGLRGRLLVGLAAPGSARIEAVAPFGQPIFIFVARGNEATLLLPRDERVLERGDPRAVLRAVTGLPLDAAALRSALTGCPATTGADGQTAGDNWRIVTSGGESVYLHRDARSAPWRVAAVVHDPGANDEWRAEYRDYEAGLPHTVRMTNRDRKRFDLRLALSQVEINMPLGAEVFRVDVPRGATPIDIRELEEAGPLRGQTGSAAPKGSPR